MANDSRLVVLCDMDGVLYRGHDVIDGAARAIGAIQAAGHAVCYATNNGWSHVSELRQRLLGMGIAVEDDDIVGASWMAAEVYRRLAPSVGHPFMVGGQELRLQLQRVGARPVPPTQAHVADSLVVGLDPTFSYRRLARAQSVAMRGCPMIATDIDALYPWHDGWLPGTGSLVRAIETASGRSAVVAGKPEVHMYQELMRRRGAERAIVVGDNLDTDIAAGKRLGAATVLALSGVATERDALARPREQRPDFIIPSIRQLPSLVQSLV